MAEEHRCQAPPEGPRLCANNCGFFGSPATLGLCSKCYRDYRLKEEQEASAKMAVEKSLLPPAPPPEAAAAQQTPSASASAAVSLPSVFKQGSSSTAVATPSGPAAAASPAPPPAGQPGRCTTCRKKVGLTGFRCRCGETFCGSHRYPEQHGCTFDFKSAGRDALAKANPVVKADKLDKI